MNNKQNLSHLRPKSRKELANEYGVSPRTLHRWFKNNSLTLPPSLLLPKDLELIYNVLGNPEHGKSR